MKAHTKKWEDERMMILSKCSPELLKIAGKHSTLWHYSKLTTLVFIQDLLSRKAQARKEIEGLKKRHVNNKSLLDCVDRGCRRNHGRLSAYNQALTDCLLIPSLKEE